MIYQVLKVINNTESTEPARTKTDAMQKAKELTKAGAAEYAAALEDGAIFYECEQVNSYKAANGFTLLNAKTPDGWTIRTPEDILTALLVYPAFATVADGFILDALEQATAERKVYDNIEDLAKHLTTYYI